MEAGQFLGGVLQQDQLPSQEGKYLCGQGGSGEDWGDCFLNVVKEFGMDSIIKYTRTSWLLSNDGTLPVLLLLGNISKWCSHHPSAA